MKNVLFHLCVKYDFKRHVLLGLDEPIEFSQTILSRGVLLRLQLTNSAELRYYGNFCLRHHGYHGSILKAKFSRHYVVYGWDCNHSLLVLRLQSFFSRLLCPWHQVFLFQSPRGGFFTARHGPIARIGTMWIVNLSRCSRNLIFMTC